MISYSVTEISNGAFMYDVRQIFEFSLAVPDGGPPEYANK